MMHDNITFYGEWTTEQGTQVTVCLMPFLEKYPQDLVTCYRYPETWGDVLRYKAEVTVNGCLCGKCMCRIGSPAYMKNAFTLFMDKLRNFYSEEDHSTSHRRSACPHKTDDTR